MSGILISLSQFAQNEISDFLSGKKSLPFKEVFSIFADVASKSASAAAKSDKFKKWSGPLKWFATNLKKLSSSGKEASKGSGIKYRRKKHARKIAKLHEKMEYKGQRAKERQLLKTEKQIAKISRRQTKKDERAKRRRVRRHLRKSENLEAAIDRKKLADEAGVSPEYNTFLGFIGGEGAVKPDKVFDTIGAFVKVIADTATITAETKSKIGSLLNQIPSQEASAQEGSGCHNFRSRKKGMGRHLEGHNATTHAYKHGAGKKKISEIKRKRKRVKVSAKRNYNQCVKNLKNKGMKGKLAKKACANVLTREQGTIGKVYTGDDYELAASQLMTQQKRLQKKMGSGKKKKYGTRQEVWDGICEMTRGKLTKSCLMKNPKGKIISKKQHGRGRALATKYGFKKKTM